jgi:tRNA (guanine37-N1)-methyltransferase
MLRFVPGVIGHEDAVNEDSFENGILDCPHYTRPVEFEGVTVPDVLLSGNHRNIAEWRRQEALKKTRRIRSDLLEGEEHEQKAYR